MQKLPIPVGTQRLIFRTDNTGRWGSASQHGGARHVFSIIILLLNLPVTDLSALQACLSAFMQ